MARTDRNVALDRATNTFWQSGYGGTTMRQLQQALDMRPGSIYAAFGDKDGLYLKAIERYTEQSILGMQSAMAGAISARSGLKKTLEKAIFGDCDTPTDLCFLMKTINELETRQPDLVESAKLALNRVREEIARQTELVLKEQGKDPVLAIELAQKLSVTVQAQIMGLKAQLKVIEDKAVIQASLEEFLTGMFTP